MDLINPEWGDNSILNDGNLDKIVTPKPLQTFEVSSPTDDDQANNDMQTTKDGRMDEDDLPEYEKELSNSFSYSGKSSSSILPSFVVCISLFA